MIFFFSLTSLGSLCSGLCIEQSRRRFTKHTWSKVRILWRKLLRAVHMSRKQGDVLRLRSWQRYVRQHQYYCPQALPGVCGKCTIPRSIFSSTSSFFFFYFSLSPTLLVPLFIYHTVRTRNDKIQLHVLCPRIFPKTYHIHCIRFKKSSK